MLWNFSDGKQIIQCFAVIDMKSELFYFFIFFVSVPNRKSKSRSRVQQFSTRVPNKDAMKRSLSESTRIQSIANDTTFQH